MANYKISGVWKNSDNVITHYAFHTVGEDSTTRAQKTTKSRAIEIVENTSNNVITWIWNYKTAKFTNGETVKVVNGSNGKYLRSNPDEKITDNLRHLIDYDWIFP
jgi:hypothetical protein